MTSPPKGWEIDQSRYRETATHGDLALLAIRLQRLVGAVQMIELSLRAQPETAEHLRNTAEEILKDVHAALEETQYNLIGQKGE